MVGTDQSLLDDHDEIIGRMESRRLVGGEMVAKKGPGEWRPEYLKMKPGEMTD
jgi:hypothetical protein